MRYADNRPVPECAKCVERAEAEKCRGCEGRTLQIFIRWHVVIEVVWIALLAYLICRK